MRIGIVDEDNLIGERNIIKLKRGVEDILKSLGFSDKTEICISFVDDEAMRVLNKEYRGIDRTTDVLSFCQADDLLGDVVISFETAKKHTEMYKTTLEEEIERLLIHGVLHLCGYDHKKENERNLMRQKEQELSAKLGKLSLKS